MTPIYKQLADLFRQKIDSGTYAFGDALPPERVIAETYGISHLTVRKALAILEDEGIVRKMRGKGTFVSKPNAMMDMETVGGFADQLRRQGINVVTEVLSQCVRPARRRYAAIFGIGRDEPVFECVRQLRDNKRPIAIEYALVPASLIGDLQNLDFAVYTFFDVFNRRGIAVSEAAKILEIVKVREPRAHLIGQEEGTSAFLLKTCFYDANVRAVGFSRIYMTDDGLTFSASAESGGEV